MTGSPEMPAADAKRVLIIGGGGHASVCAEILRSMPGVSVLGYTDLHRQSGLDLAYLGTDVALPELASTATHAFVALGSNQQRRDKFELLAELDVELLSAISSAAVVAANVRIDAGAVIMPGAVVNVNARIGRGAVINTGATVDHDCVIGDFAHVAPGAHLAGRVDVGDGALVGIGSCVVPGVRIGESAIVGAGSAVIADVSAGTIVAGVPARIINVEALTSAG